MNLTQVGQGTWYRIEAEVTSAIEHSIHEAKANKSAEIANKKLYNCYIQNYLIDSTFEFGSDSFYRKTGKEILKIVEGKEKVHQIRINKEALYEIISATSVNMGDMMNFQVFLELLVDERAHWNKTPSVSFYTTILTSNSFKAFRFNAEGAIDYNKFNTRLSKMLSNPITFLETAKQLSDEELKIYSKAVLDYRSIIPLLNNQIQVRALYDYSNGILKELCVLFESMLKRKNGATGELHSQISRLRNPINNEFLRLCNHYPIKSIAEFNTNYSSLKTELENASSPDEIFATAFRIIYGLRNQVLHNEASLMSFYSNPNETDDLIGILFSGIFFLHLV